MALPRIDTPTYQLTLPSTQEKIDFRPFLVKEQKIIMMAQETQDESQMIRAMSDLVKSCTNNKIDIDKLPIFVQMTVGHNNIINITVKIKMELRYPIYDDATQVGGLETTDGVFKLLNKCISKIVYGDTEYNRVDITDKDIEEFLEQLNTEQFQKIVEFFNTMPKLRHVVEVTNPKTKVKSEVVLEGLQSFLE